MKKLLSIILVITLIVTSGLVSFTASADVGDNSFIETEDNNDISSANIIYNDYTVFGDLYSYDVDVFEFYVPTRSGIMVTAMYDYSSMYLFLLDSNKEILIADTYAEYSNGNYFNNISYTVDAGTYYIGLLDSNEFHDDGSYIFYFEFQESHTHSYVLNYDSNSHWYECSCGDKIKNAAHTGGTATCTKKASFQSDGKLAKNCTVCKKNFSEPIKRIKTVTLSYPTATYNGKSKNPKVIVKDSSGKVISSKYYTVSKPKNIKNIGKYKITVQFKGNYTSKKDLYFTINPASTKITKTTVGKNNINISFSKKTTQTTGYQIQYSTNKSFKSAKTKTISNNKITSCNLSGLKGKTKYYIRIRTYKTAGGKKYYSDWSGTKITCTAHTHSYSKATCTKAKTCKICGATSGKALGHTNSAQCTRCGKVLFKTLTYTGTGIKKITNINLPNGDYIFTVTAVALNSNVIDNCFVKLYDGGDFLQAYCSPIILSYQRKDTEQDVFEGPIKNGVIKIQTNNNIKWTITIEPY